jgi:hypothetical protein
VNLGDTYTLGDLIERLGELPHDRTPPIGFGNPHSYRGYYADVAFEPVRGVSFGQMHEAASMAYGRTMTGYKGGEFKMHAGVDCYLAYYGSCGGGITEALLMYMLMLL